MKYFKPLLIWTNILAQAAIILSGSVLLAYSVFTHTPLKELIDFDWWIGYFVFSMWTARLLTVNKPAREENS